MSRRKTKGGEGGKKVQMSESIDRKYRKRKGNRKKGEKKRK